MRRAAVIFLASAACSPIDLDQLIFACESDAICRDAAIPIANTPDAGDAGVEDAAIEPDSGAPSTIGVCSPSAEETTIETDHWWCRNMSAAELDAFVDRFGAKILDLEIERGGRETLYTAALERKATGLYFDWAPDLAASDVRGYSERQLELLEIDVHGRIAGGPRFAATFETHFGARFYAVDSSAAQVRESIDDMLERWGWEPPAHGPRIFDLGRWLDGTQERFAWVIKVRGPARSSTIAFDRSPQDLETLNATNLILDFEQTAVNDRFTVVTATRAATDPRARFVYALTAEELDAELAGGREHITRIAPQKFGNTYRWSAQLIETTTTARDKILWKLGDGSTGSFAVLAANTAGSTIAAEREEEPFFAGETAAALVAFYAFERAQQGLLDLADVIPAYARGTSTCPGTTTRGQVTIRAALEGILLRNEYEDLKSLVVHFGEADLERRAAELGMSSTVLDGVLGCTNAAPRTSVADLVRLFRAIAVDLDEAHRAELYAILPGPNSDPAGVEWNKYWNYRAFIEEMIREEALRAGLADLRRDFLINQFATRYSRGITSTGGVVTRSVVASLDLPRCAGGSLIRETWILAMSVGDTTYTRDADRTLGLYRGELFRDPIRAAIAGFDCAP